MSKTKSKCKVISRKCNIKKRRTVKKTVEQWTEPKDPEEEELELLEDCSFKLGFSVVLLMTLLSLYTIMFNVVRERAEGNSRACSKLFSPYISFDLFDVIEASYPQQAYPNYWSIPCPARDSLLRQKACRTPSQLATDRRHRIMGTSQSTDAENATVEKIIGSETKYSLFDLSAWKGSSIATVLLVMAILLGVLLVALKKYRNLKKIAKANNGDVETGRKRDGVEMLDLVKLGNYLRSPPNINRTVDVCCPLDAAAPERTKTLCSNKLHLALELEAKRKLETGGKD